ncbi:MAG TPA: hypothetical protein VGS07_34170 [Thermoanaerobaculia bacterium]|jgi:hypothetical protein|nr:hypothetical protein [Thermoanaerobaculia bacterium]
MSLIVRAFPVLEGKEDVVRALAKALATDRAADLAQFYTCFGVKSESWHLQETPNGLWVIAVTDIDAPSKRAEQFSASHAEFDEWFKSQVLEVSGIDPSTQPLGPATEEILAWPASGKDSSTHEV